MKFGLFFEHQVPRPWADGDEQRVFAEALEQIELADRLGFDCAWLVEHHFLEEYSHSSAPELFLAAASQRTSRIRLGHGIVHTRSGDQPSGACRRTDRDPRRALGRARRVRHGRRFGGRRARRVRRRSRATSVRCGRKASASRCVASPRRRSPVTPASTCVCRPAMSSRNRFSGRIRRYGWRAAAARRSISRRRRASARSRSRSSIPRRRATGSTTTTRRSRPRACRSATP